MQSGCIGTLPEIYEPKSMRPEGAVSQAWSVAEILRIYAKVKRHAAQAQGRAVNHAEAMRA
jgi:glycogen debranching enzyme